MLTFGSGNLRPTDSVLAPSFFLQQTSVSQVEQDSAIQPQHVRNVEPSRVNIILLREAVILSHPDTAGSHTSSVMATSNVAPSESGTAAAAAAVSSPSPALSLQQPGADGLGQVALNTSLPSVLGLILAWRPSLVVATMVKPGGMARLWSR